MSVAVTMPIACASRRRWAFVAFVFGLVAVAGVAVWWTFHRPLSNGERVLVGTWRIRWDGSSNDLPLEYEFRPDRTCVIRNFDPTTGAITGEMTNLTWRRMDNTLVVRHPGRSARAGTFLDCGAPYTRCSPSRRMAPTDFGMWERSRPVGRRAANEIDPGLVR